MAQNSVKIANYTYDSAGAVSTITRGFGTQGFGGTMGFLHNLTSNFAYDTAGRVTSIEHRKNPTTVLEKFVYSYDEKSRISSINSHQDGLINYTYDATDQLKSVTYQTPLPDPANTFFAGKQTNPALPTVGSIDFIALVARGMQARATVDCAGSCIMLDRTCLARQSRCRNDVDTGYTQEQNIGRFHTETSHLLQWQSCFVDHYTQT
jgi:hypothetical protein